MDYKDKYIKYKSKYLELRKFNYQTGGNNFNELLVKWKKIGFPYAKHLIDEKKIYNQLFNIYKIYIYSVK